MRSVELKLDPMCPEPACMIMYSVLMRHTSVSSSARATGSDAAARTASIASRDTYESPLSPASCLSEWSFSPIRVRHWNAEHIEHAERAWLCELRVQRLSRGPSTIHDQHRAGHVRGCRRGQKQHGAVIVVVAGHASERCALDVLGDELRRMVGFLDAAGDERVDADAER